MEFFTSRVAVRAFLSVGTLIVAKEAMRDSFTASPATLKSASFSWSGGLARKSVAALPWLRDTERSEQSMPKYEQKKTLERKFAKVFLFSMKDL